MEKRLFTLADLHAAARNFGIMAISNLMDGAEIRGKPDEVHYLRCIEAINKQEFENWK